MYFVNYVVGCFIKFLPIIEINNFISYAEIKKSMSDFEGLVYVNSKEPCTKRVITLIFQCLLHQKYCSLSQYFRIS